MRPLAVLILVLGAVAALVFALSSITGTEVRGGTSAVGPSNVRPAESAPEEPPSALTRPDVVVPPAQSVPAGDVGARRQVEDLPVEGVHANFLQGLVVDPDGVPVPKASVGLYLGEDVSDMGRFRTLLGEGELAKALRRVETDDQGKFAFSGVAPGNDYQIVVDHPEFATKYHGPVVVADRGLIEERIVLERGHQLQGLVRDQSSGAPIEGAVLTLDDPFFALIATNKRRKNPRRLITKSNAEGYYLFPNVSPGQRVLVCEAKGFATQLISDLNFTGDPKRVTQDCVLEIGQIIAGRVVDPDLHGIPNAQVTATMHENGVVSRGSAVSKENGEFVIEDVGEGSYILQTEVRGWDVDPIPRVSAGDTDVLIRVYPQGAVAGRVIAGPGGPQVRDFTIIVRAFHPTDIAYGHLVKKQNFQASADGRFEISGISEGRYVLQANADGYAYSFSEPFQIDQGITTPDVLVQMNAGGSLKGRVVSIYTKEPIAGAVVATNENNWIESDFTTMLGGISPSALTKTEARTDNEGRFEIELVTSGEYQVTISHPEFTRVIRNDVRIQEGQPTDLGRIELSSGATLTGTVYASDGSRARGIDVYLRAVDGDLNRHMQTRTDAQGRYRLTGCPPGTYKVSAARPTSPGSSGNPFDVILDMKHSETQIDLADGREYTQDLHMGGS